MSVTLSSALAWARNEVGAGETSDEEAGKLAAEQIKKDMAAITAAAERATREVPERSEEDARRQAIFDTAYVVAAADGAVSAIEHQKLIVALRGMFGQDLEQDIIEDGLEMSRVLREERDLKGCCDAIAAALPEQDARYSALVIASAVGWLGGGVGAKEGLALQALAKAFEVPTQALHQLMAAGAKL